MKHKAAILCASCAVVAGKSLLFLPIDDRFTTRDAFLHMAPLATEFTTVLTPPPVLLSHAATPAPLNNLTTWVVANMPLADVAVVSMEMYVYGGLVASRKSNMSATEAIARASDLYGLLSAAHASKPSFRSYVGATVMRIPSYNTPPTDFEDPAYWALYGRDLAEFSFLSSEAKVTGNASYESQAQHFRSLVPEDVVSDWLWRRSRNANVTASLLGLLPPKPVSPVSQWPANTAVPALYITLDDAQEFGFDVDEANATKAQAESMGLLGPVVKVYPGADEVALVMLARAVSDARKLTGILPPIKLGVAFRNLSTSTSIPSYESQPMLATVLANAEAAGLQAEVLPASSAALPSTPPAGWDAALLVNNYDTATQQEAATQPAAGAAPGSGYGGFSTALCGWASAVPVAVADTRFCNGADIALVSELLAYARCPPLQGMPRFAYAGWNTDGNTLGTAIANAALLSMAPWPLSQAEQQANARFNTLRLVEDRWWQSDLRQTANAWIAQTNNQTQYSLADDLPFYEALAGWPLAAATDAVSAAFSTNITLLQAYFPWNRTFEIGLVTPSTTD